MPLSPSTLLHNNRYRIDTLLGAGGMGAVYRAWDTVLDRPCALKENTGGDAAQFEREARILARLKHPNLPSVHDHFVIPGQGQYLVMEFVEGEDLQTRLRREGRLSESDALRWIGQVLDALEYLHRQNPPIIHRDVKPPNIKITPNGQAMLVDFGIAKLYDPNAPTTVGARAVTPGFAAIEQYGRGGRTDQRTDVYAIGATLYALLTGEAPVESLERVAGEELLPPRALNPAISPRIEAAILKALELAFRDRWQTVAELRMALQAVGTLLLPSQPAAPSVSPPLLPPGTAPRTPLTRPTARAVLIVSSLIVAVLVPVAIVGGLILAGRFSPLATPTYTPTNTNMPTQRPSPTVTLTPFPTPTVTSIPFTPTLTSGISATPVSNVGGQSQVTIRGVIGVGDLDKEQLTIVNTGGDMSLVGWTIHDSQGNVFFFPALALFQGGAVTVHTKSGTNTVIDLYWNQSTTMWQTGEVVSLVDPSGTTQTTYTIP